MTQDEANWTMLRMLVIDTIFQNPQADTLMDIVMGLAQQQGISPDILLDACVKCADHGDIEAIDPMNPHSTIMLTSQGRENRAGYVALLDGAESLASAALANGTTPDLAGYLDTRCN